MPISYSIDTSTGILMTTLSGAVSWQEFANYFETTRQDPAFHGELHRLIVAANVTSYPDRTELQSIASSLKGRLQSGTVRLAVVSADPLDRGMLSMMLGQGGMAGRYEIFEDIDTARSWLLEETT